MATSGVHTFTMDVSDLCEEAYERCGLEMRSGYDAKSARRSLNLMLVELGNHQVNLWKALPIELSITQGTASYNLNAEYQDLSDVRVVLDNNTELGLMRLNRDEYADRPNKEQQGRPTQYYVERTNPCKIYVWPAPNQSYVIKAYAHEQMESVTEATQTVDIPTRFVPAITAGLAYYISLKNAPEKSQMLKIVYDEELQRAQYEDRERVSLKVLPKVGW